MVGGKREEHRVSSSENTGKGKTKEGTRGLSRPLPNMKKGMIRGKKSKANMRNIVQGMEEKRAKIQGNQTEKKERGLRSSMALHHKRRQKTSRKTPARKESEKG